MNPGKLRHRITIQSPTVVADGSGGYTVSGYSEVATVWAAVIPLTAQEQYFAQQLNQRTTHRIRTRYRNDVTAAMRILLGTRSFEIVGVRNIGERGRELEIMAMEQ